MYALSEEKMTKKEKKMKNLVNFLIVTNLIRIRVHFYLFLIYAFQVNHKNENFVGRHPIFSPL